MPDFWQHYFLPLLFPNKGPRRSSPTQGCRSNSRRRRRRRRRRRNEEEEE